MILKLFQLMENNANDTASSPNYLKFQKIDAPDLGESVPSKTRRRYGYQRHLFLLNLKRAQSLCHQSKYATIPLQVLTLNCFFGQGYHIQFDLTCKLIRYGLQKLIVVTQIWVPTSILRFTLTPLRSIVNTMDLNNVNGTSFKIHTGL